MDFEFSLGLQSRQLNVAFLFRQASFSGAVVLPQSGLLGPIGWLGKDEGIVYDDWGFILVDKDGFVIRVFQVFMRH
jgi:hypothetical protein